MAAGVIKSGLATQLTAPVTETVFGVVPAALAATTKFSAFTSEGLEAKKTTAQGIGLLSGKLHGQAARRVVTEWTAGGPVAMDLMARGLQQWLFPMFGSYGQTAATFVEDGVTLAYSSVHAPGPMAGNSFCIQKGVPAVDTGAVEPFTYVGCKISEWEIAVAKAEIAKLTLTIEARNELGGAMNSDPLNVSLPGLVTYVPPPAGGVFTFLEGSIFTGGTCSTTSGVTTVAAPVKAANIRAASVKYSVPLDLERFNMGGAGFKSEQVDNNLRIPSGSLTAEWLSSQSRYNAYAADTPTTFQLNFIGPSIGSGSDFSTLSILIPDIFLEGETPKVGGPEVVVQTIPWVGLDDGTNNVIQALYWTLDSV
jgi:Phage tail tube protein